ncbi:LysM peptidoglycan-binding domain-containing M23 family metallopeptidase [Planococcus ruber]|uniref:LysM peptidoglycan-binding domain-containing M23 family metallopeptidase n=1 Tax=Planococcus ruber TaxID=2027871 RepID=UPI001FED747D|nr:M23 family metallopeptidase [Planococcus ruber]MCJ1909077.1 M23 family metallopeptidase [Planococcus ruber]
MKEIKKAGQSIKLKWAAASILLVTGFGITTVSAKPIEESGLEPVYHIYNNGEYLGAVSDSASLKTAAAERIDHIQTSYEELDLQVDRGVKVIEEKVFASPISRVGEAFDRVAAALPIKAAAFRLAAGDETAVYVKDREAYNETIKQVKLAFASPEELAEWEERMETGKAPAEIGVGESRLTDLAIAEKISGASQQVDPSEVMTVDQAVSYLLKGERFHRAANGESAQMIAEKFDVTVEDLKEMNPKLNLAAFDSGTSIKIAEEGPKVTVYVQREEKTAKAIPNKTVTKKDKHVLVGEKKVKEKGAAGEKQLTYAIREENGKRTGRTLAAEAVAKEPVDRIVLEGTKPLPSVGTGKFAWPAEGGYISSGRGERWGRLHNGIDIARPDGLAIKSADHGVVKAAGAAGTFGNRVVVDHKNGYETIYAHLSSIDVKVGEKVPKGKKLGVMGSTGRSTGLHLHFEVSYKGVTKNPLNYIK